MSVTLTFSIGNAVKQNNALILESTGVLKYIEVYAGHFNSGDNVQYNEDSVFLDDNLINNLKKIDNINSIFYVLDASRFMSFSSGRNGRYETSYMNLYGIDFNEAEKFGLKLINNIKPNFSNYKFNPNNKSIRIVGGQYFEYMFENTLMYKKSYQSFSRYMNSPATQYMFARWGDKNMNTNPPLPPFVNADKDDIFLNIEYFNNTSSGQQQLSEYDVNYDPDNIISNTDTDAYKYKKYKIILDGRLDWERSKDNNFLSSISCHDIFVDLDTAKTLIREAYKLNKITNPYRDAAVNSKVHIPEFQYTMVIVEAKDINNVSDITKEINKMGYKVYDAMSIIENEQLRARSNQFILGFLGCLSLLVSAISITNTMITSVYERTKEIGIMKVLGCKIGNIQLMFLIESGFIGFIGGVIGMSLSYYLSNFMNKLVTGEIENLGAFANIISNYIEGMKSDIFSSFNSGVTMKVSVITPQLWLLIITGTTLIGLIAGYIPSLAASRIEALKAIKTDK